jgi:Tfp pilus assembly protein PilN
MDSGRRTGAEGIIAIIESQVMKDIDLLPDWYTSGKRKQQSLRSQYLVLVGVVVIMNVWNFVAAHSLSWTEQRIREDMHKCSKAKAVMAKTKEMTGQIDELSKKAKLLDAIDSKINIAAVLSELSFLVDGKIVLSDVKLDAQEFDTDVQGSPSASGIRVAGTSSRKSTDEHLGDERFLVTLRGIAEQTSDVGKFVRRLEESDYFRNVSLAFSRSKNVKVSVGQGDEQRQVSEFEISCDLANYQLVQNASGVQ